MRNRVEGEQRFFRSRQRTTPPSERENPTVAAQEAAAGPVSVHEDPFQTSFGGEPQRESVSVRTIDVFREFVKMMYRRNQTSV